MDENDQNYKKAKSRVAHLRAFYSSLITYVIVNICLIIINLITDPHHLWFYWISIIWGIVLAVQAIKIFSFRDAFLGEEWEKKKIRDLLNKDKK